MDKQSRAPLIIAVVLLLLPVLYVGSYLALVVPSGVRHLIREPLKTKVTTPYRIREVDSYFWPLEQIDRKLRAWAWDQLAPLQETDSTGGNPGAQT